MAQPTISREAYNAIMAYQPKNLDEFEQLIAGRFLNIDHPQNGPLGKVVYQSIMKHARKDGILAPEKYCLARIEADNEDDVSTAFFTLHMMISAANSEGSGGLYDSAYTDFLQMSEECAAFPCVIKLFKIVD